MSTTNLEEAATVASEFISSLDNLPAEVNYLLAEMKHKDTRAQELHTEIQKESAKYVRHSLRSAPAQPLSAKDAAIPLAVQAHYVEIDRLGEEKARLAERIVQLVARARTKLDCDLSRVLVLQGEPELATQPGFYYGTPAAAVAQVNDSLRGAVSVADVPVTPASTSVSAGAPPQKRRRTGAGAVPSAGSIKLPSPAPVAVAPVPAVTQRASRLAQQVQSRNSPAARGRHAAAAAAAMAAAAMDVDEDAEGEEDVEDDAGEDGGDAEDTEIYCFCQKMSYGEMIACDGPECRYQWFHLDCVNLKPPLPDQWFCSDCQARGNARALGGGPERRKGRKK